MKSDYEAWVGALSTEKALAIAAYGESVAAYRYRTLSEKVDSPHHQKLFTEIADEEQGHHLQVQEILRERFPGSDFVLSPEDKELVTVGQRMIEVSDRQSLDKALELLRESELQTGRYYQCLHDVTTDTDLKPFLKEMADECFEHAEKLREIPPLPD